MNMPKKIGKYEVISQIASGGFGVIYKGWDPFIKRPVAIKLCAVPDAEVRQRFHREAQFVGNLVHRNITLVFDFGVEGDIPYIVQEFLTGYDLDEMLNAGVLKDVRALASILLQICDGLDFAHNRGIVHRDIKPSNIRVLEDGTVKIMDFGIAKSVESRSKLTQTGIALGTAGYLAPEQIQGGAVDPRTDVFAVGVLAYELATGARPFEGKSLSNVLYKILNEQPRNPLEVSSDCLPELSAVIERCLAKSPGDRYQSARELSDALRNLPLPDIFDTDNALEQTTGILRQVLTRMEKRADEAPGAETKDISVQGMPEGPKIPPIQPPHATEISHAPGTGETDEHHRSPVFLIFVILVLVVVGSGAVLYFSHTAQDLVFGQEGAPWIPTPTPVPTATPTPTPTATPSPIPTATPTPEPIPTATPAPVRVQMVVDPPAVVTINGREYKSGNRVPGGTAMLIPGVYTFVLKYPDFPIQTIRKTVTPATRTISLVTDIGQITIMVDPSSAPTGGVAYLDGERLGPVPLIRKKVPAGKHKLVIRWQGHEPFRQDVVIASLPSPELRVVGAAPPK